MAADALEHIPSQGKKKAEGSILGTLPVVPFYLENENYPRGTLPLVNPVVFALANMRASGHA